MVDGARDISEQSKEAGTLESLRNAIRRGAVFLLLAAMVVGFSLAQPAFININNLMSVLQAVSVVAIIGAGVSITLAINGFDLSVGAVAASSVMAASYAMIVLGLNAWQTVPLVLAFGALVGLANAFLIVRLKVPDLLATLATMFLLTGLQLIPTAGRSISVGLILPDGSTASGKYDPAFLTIGRSSLFGFIPLPVVLMAIVAIVLFILTEKTRLGRLIYATGGNETAARLAGANVDRIKTFAYVLSGTLAALGGIIVAARVGRGDVSSGASLLMDSVAAALIGFAVLALRRPNVLGTLVGAVFVGVLLNGLTMLNAPYYTQDFIKGAVLVGALALTYGVARTKI
ncbi:MULTISPECIES: ABC transporter permease [Agrobacterium tumefaciens complex]|jgi:simple sugar transport system permease protein|uniref:ABC transporter permease n=1 Tax=Agrobacterium tumefaciens TaxID=358 RepID=A0AAP9E8P1_AGRTU|nr:ABC transporter permease [Agrobacterium tumefaciens]MCP2133709.1 simple sugar transport system permease protein [Rhizobium sp. SLBN-94]KAA1235330.1 ABC transporter permease [Agrobacterium tumefaciens]MBP2573685.1 simple sugar transport system permease protein [Agrobacterium tumefaciens]NSZ61274.1 ABC transporter permease [Agrobacterium tumefaciens]QDY96723.1 ABC transporter permease [Agrobacterium tumefaciens]